MTDLTHSLAFNYALLDVESRVVIQQRATEIRTIIKRTAQDVIDIGQKLIEVKERLPRGQFDLWVSVELGVERASAYRFIAVAERFSTVSQIETIAPSALYALAAPSAPDSARDEALARAASGEQITHQKARQIIVEHKPNPAPAPHPDYQHQAAIEQILRTLDQWDDSARPGRLQEAYGHARQIRDLGAHDRMFRLIDAAVEGKPPAALPDFDDAQRRAQALGWSLAKHGAWWKLTGPDGGDHSAFEPSRQLDTIERLEQQAAALVSGLAPITIQTNKGPIEITPLYRNGVLALHDIQNSLDTAVTHIASGKRVASFARHTSAGQALEHLSSLDWTQIAPDGAMSPALALVVARVLVQFDDVDHVEIRRAKLAELEAAAAREAAPTAPEGDPRAQIAALLTQIAPLIRGITTDDQLSLSQAIADLNECVEGTEAEHWLSVGWALLDLVPESAVAR